VCSVEIEAAAEACPWHPRVANRRRETRRLRGQQRV